MCVAIYRPPGQHVDKDIIRRALQNNHDGAGFAFAKDGGLLLYRDPDPTFSSFWAALKSELSDRAKNCPMIIHLRYATHGSKNKENTHPIITHSGQNAIVHNGIIGAAPTAKDDDRSDTALFCTQLLERLPERLDKHPELIPYLESVIGYSKMVILNASGAVTFLRASSGTWHEGLWYSNNNALPPPTRATSVTTTKPTTHTPYTTNFRLFATFNSTRVKRTVKIDAFINKATGTLYLRTVNRTGGGGFWNSPDAKGIRMCDSCNDEIALPHNDIPFACHQRLCYECLDDWKFILDIVKDADNTEIITEPQTQPTKQTRRGKKRRGRLTDAELAALFDKEDSANTPKDCCTPPSPEDPPTEQLPIAPVSEPAPLPEPDTTDEGSIALLAMPASAQADASTDTQPIRQEN